MKLWRKQAKNGNGRMIKRMAQMQEMMFKDQPKTYPLLDALFKRAGMSYALSEKQQATLRRMIESSKEATPEEPANEAQ